MGIMDRIKNVTGNNGYGDNYDDDYYNNFDDEYGPMGD